MTVGEIAVRIVVESDEATRKLAETNAAATLTAQTLGEVAAAGATLTGALGEAKKAQDDGKTSAEGATQAGKKFVVTINDAADAAEDLTGPIRENADQTALYNDYLEQNAAALEDNVRAESDLAEQQQQSSTQRNTALTTEIGIVEQLEINLGDLKDAMRRATDPADVARLREEFVKTKVELDRLRRSDFQNLRRETEQTRVQVTQGTQAIAGMLLLLNSVDSGKPTGELGKIRQSFLQSANAALGLVFTMKMMGPAAAGMAGPVGIGVGALLLLTTYFNSTSEAAKAAAEKGVGEFKKSLAGLPTATLPVVEKDIEGKLARAKTELEKYYTFIQTREGELVKVATSNPGDSARRQRLEADIEHYESLKTAAKEYREEVQVTDRMEELGNEVTLEKLGTITAASEKVKKLREEQATIDVRTEAGRAKMADTQEKIAAIETSVNEALLTKEQRMARSAELAGTNLQMERGSVEVYRTILEEQLKGNLTDKERLEIVKKIESLHDVELNQARQAYTANQIDTAEYRKKVEALVRTATTQTQLIAGQNEIKALNAADVSLAESKMALGKGTLQQVLAAIDAELKQKDLHGRELLSKQERLALEQKIVTLLRAQHASEESMTISNEKAQTALIKNDRIRAISLEDIRHRERLITIEKEEQSAIEAGVDKADAAKARKDAERTEQTAHVVNLGEIERTQNVKIAEMRIKTIENEESRATEQYELERQRIKDSGQDKAVIDAQLAVLDKEYSDAGHAREMANLNQTAAVLSEIGSALHDAMGGAGGDFLSKMLGALRVAMQIATTIKAMEAGSMGGALGPLSIIGSVLGLIGLFSEGGTVGHAPGAIEQKTTRTNRFLLEAMDVKNSSSMYAGAVSETSKVASSSRSRETTADMESDSLKEKSASAIRKSSTSRESSSAKASDRSATSEKSTTRSATSAKESSTMKTGSVDRASSTDRAAIRTASSTRDSSAVAESLRRSFSTIVNEQGEIEEGSFIVKERRASEYRELLDAMGAKTVTGGIPHKDSVLASTSSGKAVLLTPNERVVAPELSRIAAAINDGSLTREQAAAITVKIKAGMIGSGAAPASIEPPVAASVRRFQEGGPVSAPGGFMFHDLRFAAGGDNSDVVAELKALRSSNAEVKAAIAGIRLEPMVGEFRATIDYDNLEVRLRSMEQDMDQWRKSKVF